MVYWTLHHSSHCPPENEGFAADRFGHIEQRRHIASTAIRQGCCQGIQAPGLGTSKESRRGSHVYEINCIINTWLWNFGRPQPRVGGLSVAKTEMIRRKSRSETSQRAWDTRQARNWAESGLHLKRTRRRKSPAETYDMHIPGIYLSYMKAQ
jgi:hypothetical protein